MVPFSYDIPLSIGGKVSATNPVSSVVNTQSREYECKGDLSVSKEISQLAHLTISQANKGQIGVTLISESQVYKWTRKEEADSHQLYAKLFADKFFSVPKIEVFDWKSSFSQKNELEGVLSKLKIQTNGHRGEAEVVLFMEKVNGKDLAEFILSHDKTPFNPDQNVKFFKSLGSVTLVDLFMGNLDRIIKPDDENGYSLSEASPFAPRLDNIMIQSNFCLYLIDNELEPGLDNKAYNSFLKELFEDRSWDERLVEEAKIALSVWVNDEAEGKGQWFESALETEEFAKAFCLGLHEALEHIASLKDIPDSLKERLDIFKEGFAPAGNDSRPASVYHNLEDVWYPAVLRAIESKNKKELDKLLEKSEGIAGKEVDAIKLLSQENKWDGLRQFVEQTQDGIGSVEFLVPDGCFAAPLTASRSNNDNSSDSIDLTPLVKHSPPKTTHALLTAPLKAVPPPTPASEEKA